MKPYEEIKFPNGYLRWIREGDQYVCRMSEEYMERMKSLHETETQELDYKTLWKQMCERCDELDKKLAEAEKQDPVSHLWECLGRWSAYLSNHDLGKLGPPNYLVEAVKNATQPKCEWVDLTDEEIDQGLLRSYYALQNAHAWRAGVEWATKQLKEKNT